MHSDERPPPSFPENELNFHQAIERQACISKLSCRYNLKQESRFLAQQEAPHYALLVQFLETGKTKAAAHTAVIL